MFNHKITVIQVLPALNSGGVEKGTLEIGRYLVKQGHESIVVSAAGRLVQSLIDEGSRHIEADIGAKKLSTLKYIPWFKQLMRDIRPDIVHVRSRLPAWVVYLAWKSLPENERPRLISTFHGQHSVNRYSAIMTKSERIITVSEMMRDYILRSYPDVDPEKISVVYRGVDMTLYNPDFFPNQNWQDHWIATYPQTRNKPLLTFAGRLSRRKGIEDFIQIIAELKQSGLPVHGLIVGETSPKKKEYRQELERLIHEKQLNNDITFTGHRSDLQNIIAISKAVFSLSKEPESFGRTVTESLSLGVPVVGYSHGGVKEQLERLFPEGKIEVGNVNEAAEVTRKILTGSSVQIRRNDIFTLENMCSETLKTYRELMADKRRVVLDR
ncbi:glycosyltransferase family 4 protein [Methylotuvimicrobium alcaliphilum]|uniref:Glycosyl transferase group 1 n=1 Tax=Methylotuvimicrobium alcaliphilum (strain DSM 19304 / NCIMB 14124 / VKM B-2133 / 20Z) TaxID=1091494 RepID=G4T168_META2|nr:glycosyltransferase family 4 protein [Methylotuvimicrobium alcaliphilum]CCE24599.1 Glycosyl transferase group 1 [Methylotuvimicrobium alcaliphilum 20Z]